MNTGQDEVRLVTEENRRGKIGQVLGSIMKNHWPIITGVIGLGALATGVGLAASESVDAFIPVGTSNLAMVLALSGSALLFVSIWGESINNAIACKEHRKRNFIEIAGRVVGGTILGSIGYAGMHLGLGQILQDYMSIEGSIAVQAAGGFFVGALIGGLLCVLSVYHCQYKTPNERIPRYTTIIMGLGFVCAASAVVGPALSLAMQAVAIDASELLAVEIIVTMAMASMVVGIMALSEIVDTPHRHRYGNTRTT